MAEKPSQRQRRPRRDFLSLSAQQSAEQRAELLKPLRGKTRLAARRKLLLQDFRAWLDGIDGEAATTERKRELTDYFATLLDERPNLASIEKKHRFLEAFAKLGTPVGATQATGVSWRAHYDWMERDPLYPERYAEALEQSTQRMEQEGIRRAIGSDRVVLHNGKPVMVEDPTLPVGPDGKRQRRILTYRDGSDLLLMFMLKSRRPAVYRDTPPTVNVGPNAGASMGNVEQHVHIYLPSNGREVGEAAR